MLGLRVLGGVGEVSLVRGVGGLARCRGLGLEGLLAALDGVHCLGLLLLGLVGPAALGGAVGLIWQGALVLIVLASLTALFSRGRSD